MITSEKVRQTWLSVVAAVGLALALVALAVGISAYGPGAQVQQGGDAYFDILRASRGRFSIDLTVPELRVSSAMTLPSVTVTDTLALGESGPIFQFGRLNLRGSRLLMDVGSRAWIEGGSDVVTITPSLFAEGLVVNSPSDIRLESRGLAEIFVGSEESGGGVRVRTEDSATTVTIPASTFVITSDVGTGDGRSRSFRFYPDRGCEVDVDWVIFGDVEENYNGTQLVVDDVNGEISGVAPNGSIWFDSPDVTLSSPGGSGVMRFGDPFSEGGGAGITLLNGLGAGTGILMLSSQNYILVDSPETLVQGALKPSGSTGASTIYACTGVVTYQNTSRTELCIIPSGMTIVDVSLLVTTAFNDSGTDVLNCGVGNPTPTELVNNLDVSTTGLHRAGESGSMPLGLLGESYSQVIPACRYTGQNGNATTGSAVLIVYYGSW